MQEINSLTQCTEVQLEEAHRKYLIIHSYLLKSKSLEVISAEENISIRTLRYWIQKYQELGLRGLVRMERTDKRNVKVDLAIQDQVKKIFLSNKGISITSIYRRTLAWCEDNDLQFPSYHQVRAITKTIPQNITKLAHDGTKKYANEFDLVYLREANYPNEIWQADHTMLDIEVLNEKGKPERPWLTVILDDYSRAVAGFFIDFKSPDTLRTTLTLRKAIWRKENKNWPICGIPEIFYTDHGSDYTSKHMEQVSADIRMNLSFSRVGVPRGRGKIERFFQSINTMFLQDLPGYIKNKKTTKLLTVSEFVEKITSFILNTYHHRTHGTTKKEPINMWNEFGFLPNIPNSLDELDLLLLTPAKPRKVHSDGIHFMGLKYMHTNLSAFVGENVVIRYDPRDIAEIRVFFNGEFLCTAISSSIDGYSIGVKEIEAARNKQKRELKKQVMHTKSVVENLKAEKDAEHPRSDTENSPKKTTLKRYYHE
ncbi:Mu transposase C-terminal domain-containing protein [Peribacillus loiseleuriae]|uniref:Transposase n=1 Tax=Peribacillus loiseleuriae TaxID=1679170 RepID=A0A0K9G4G1_9BACI|nr:Mu transposase C-terminal domain-containing protein [Peribacillus loiseleuriae]KMY41503.1 transposase [Peribacillus loiseleuriae]